MTSKKSPKKPAPKKSGKLRPEDVIVVKKRDGNVLGLYRDGAAFTHLDALGNATGILTAQGLLVTSREGIPWMPQEFTFRVSEFERVPFVPVSDWMSEWIRAGIILGERTTIIRKKGNVFKQDWGRTEDQAVSVEIWLDWFRWRESGVKIPFSKFQGIADYKGHQADALRQQLARLGLSTKI